MPQTPNKKFKITVPITRCYLRKTADGVEKYVVEGMASNTNLDLTGERMAESAITSMAKSLETHPVIFKSEHLDEWDAEFGEVTALYATDENRLMMEAELDPDHHRTKTLVTALAKGRQLGLSIGGYVQEATYEWLADLGRKVKTYTDILLEEISVTGSPAVADTWLTNINKSVKDWKEMSMPEKEELTKKESEEQAPTADESQKASEPTTETPASEEGAEPAVQAPTEDTEAAGTAAENAPVDEEAAAQEDETKADTDESEAEKSAPEQAEHDISAIAKSTVLGSWAEADLAEGAINDLSFNLRWGIWGVMADADKSAEEKQAFVEAALAEYAKLISIICAALIASDLSTETAKSVQEAFTGQAPADITKSITQRDSDIAELNKSLETKEVDLGQLQKSLDETTRQLEATQTELETTKARKAHAVVGKFGEAEDDKKPNEIARAAQTKFAGFITGGLR